MNLPIVFLVVVITIVILIVIFSTNIRVMNIQDLIKKPIHLDWDSLPSGQPPCSFWSGDRQFGCRMSPACTLKGTDCVHSCDKYPQPICDSKSECVWGVPNNKGQASCYNK